MPPQTNRLSAWAAAALGGTICGSVCSLDVWDCGVGRIG